MEDAAQALGARAETGAPAGGAGDAGCFSFFPTKNLGAWGDGGAVVTSRDDVAARVRRLRAHGAVAPYVHAELGRNSRLDALQAAVLLAKTRHLPAWQAARERLASRYLAELAEPAADAAPRAACSCGARVARVRRAHRRSGTRSRSSSASAASRRASTTRCRSTGRSASAASRSRPCRTRKRLCRTALALPMFAAMTDAQQAHVIEQVKRFFA